MVMTQFHPGILVKVPGNGRLKKDLLFIKEGSSTICLLTEQNFTFGVRPIYIYILYIYILDL